MKNLTKLALSSLVILALGASAAFAQVFPTPKLPIADILIINKAYTNEFVPKEIEVGYSPSKVYVSGATYPSTWEWAGKTKTPGCGKDDRIVLSNDTQNVLSVLLAAALTGKKIKCWVGNTCDGDAPVASSCKLVQ